MEKGPSQKYLEKNYTRWNQTSKCTPKILPWVRNIGQQYPELYTHRHVWFTDLRKELAGSRESQRVKLFELIQLVLEQILLENWKIPECVGLNFYP